MTTILTARFGRGSMDKKSAIQEYCEACRRQVGVSKTDYQLHEDHLREQDALLRIIQNQSKPQFGREVLANIVGSASYDIILRIFRGLIR